MSSDCTDICDTVYEIMCGGCPHCTACQNAEDEMNHDQMLVCMRSLCMKGDKYPVHFVPVRVDND
jgi:hypothetical protein